MPTKAKTLFALLALVAFSASAPVIQAAAAADFDDYAKVISVAPQIEQVNVPQQECHTEYVPVERRARARGVGGSVLGGVAGGILGNQVGNGNGRTAATAVGAITGAIVGDRMQNEETVTVAEQPVRQCRTVEHWESRNNGYAVTYEYRGHAYTTVMPYDPGQRMRVQVSVSPRI